MRKGVGEHVNTPGRASGSCPPLIECGCTLVSVSSRFHSNHSYVLCPNPDLLYFSILLWFTETWHIDALVYEVG